jgi:tetratricopeptide (TPR) repeat protein
MNVAIELALQGRRVLVVDFDLEAPGLQSYKPFTKRKKNKGIVEYVNEYIDTAIAPDVTEYLMESENLGEGKKIWLMPSGRIDSSYATRLSRIDWNHLYSKNHGYLFFEDLKQQWRDTINPDYVLIDSRTGHTDVGGICTRQLPDAVVAMMIPNHQNIAGMQQVVNDIRLENESKLENPILLHFVFSNVPNIDDEGDLLGSLTRKAGKSLGFNSESVRIHNYPSLDLLDQVIHTLERPKTSLSREYRELVNVIQRVNPEDRDGALSWLSVVAKEAKFQWTDEDENRFAKILKKHDTDKRVLAAAGDVKARLGDFRVARMLFGAALEIGNRDPEVLNRYAQVLLILKDHDEAGQIFKEILGSARCNPQQVLRAVRGLSEIFTPKRKNQISPLVGLSKYAAIIGLSPKNRIKISNVLLSNGHPKVAREVLQEVLLTKLGEEIDFDPTDDLTLVAIGCGEWLQAIDIINRWGHPDSEIRDSFNLAMAIWAKDREPVIDRFQAVLDIHKTHENDKDFTENANYDQCIALAYGLCGRKEEGLEMLTESTRLAKKSKNEIFSAWRYHYVPSSQFLEDNEEIKHFIKEHKNIPKFFVN